MKKRMMYLAAIALFVLVIVGASIAYNSLSEGYQPPQETEPSSVTTATGTPQDERTAQDFAVRDREGNTVRLSDHIGRPVVLNFWATWCGYCVEELPAFEEAYRAHGDEVVFMMIDATDAVYETEQTVERFLAENGYTFPVYYDTAAEASERYGAYSIPLTVFIDQNGQVVYTRRGAMNASQLALYMESYLGVS